MPHIRTELTLCKADNPVKKHYHLMRTYPKTSRVALTAIFLASFAGLSCLFFSITRPGVVPPTPELRLGPDRFPLTGPTTPTLASATADREIANSKVEETNDRVSSKTSGNEKIDPGPTTRIITNKMRMQLIAALAGHSAGRVEIAVENSSSDDEEFGKSLISALTEAGVPAAFVPAGNRTTNYRTTGIEIAGEEPLLSELIKALSKIDVPAKTTGTHRHDNGEVSNVIITIPRVSRP